MLVKPYPLIFKPRDHVLTKGKFHDPWPFFQKFHGLLIAGLIKLIHDPYAIKLFTPVKYIPFPFQ